MSEELVRFVVETLEIKEDLGIKGKSGILASMKSRKKFLQTGEIIGFGLPIHPRTVHGWIRLNYGLGV